MNAKEKHDELLAEAPATQPASAPISSATEQSCIQPRAYEIWQARGGGSDSALDDWLQAEAELKQERKIEQPGYSQRATAG